MDRATDDQKAREAVTAVLGGDVDAFEWIVRRWQGPLIDLAYRFCRRPALAEELAQEAFTRAFRRLAQWRGDAAFSTWLFAVAANVYRSRLRKKKLPTIPLESLEEVSSWRADEEDLEEAERAEIVREAVLALPVKYRDAVVLYYFHEMSVDAAARSLGVAEGTLKSQLFRGRKMLESRLGPVLRTDDDEEEAAA